MSYEQDEKEPLPDQVRPKGGPIDKREMQALVHGILSDAAAYTDDELSPERAEATDYYQGKPFGNEEEGRSQIVLTEVKDAVRAVMPGLMRVFFGPDRAVEFTPTGPGKEQQAKQETDYVQHVFVKNKGFFVLHSAFKDALIRKIGVIKWGWDDTSSDQPIELDGIDEPSLEALAGDESVTLTRVETDKESGLSKVFGTRRVKSGKPWVKAVPPEELIFTRQARSEDDAVCIAHRTDLSRGELVAMGIDEKVIDEAAGGTDDTQLRDNLEEISRRQVAKNDTGGTDPDAGEANQKILYCEAYMRVDANGDGVRELRKICTVGPNYTVVNGDGLGEVVDSICMAIGTPDPEPHTMLGLSFHDDVGDIQRVKSSVLRSTLDSLALSIYPRTAYVENQAAVEDILNTEIGAPMRMRAPGMVQTFQHNFTGRDALPMLDLFDGITEQRTGRDKGSMGLDADALQSSTDEAVHAAVMSSQERQEMLARIFAESLVKPMFAGLRQLFVEHQPKAETVRLRGKWVEVDPRTWDADADVDVKVALGTSDIAKKIDTLMSIAAKQEQIIQLLGPSNPLCTLAQLRNTYARIVELKGFYEADEFFLEVDPNWQPPQQAPQPSPEQIQAQAMMEIEKMKATKDIAIKQRELELKEQSMMLEHDRAIAQMAQDREMQRYELELKYHAAVTSTQVNAQIQHTKNILDADAAHRSLDQDEAATARDHGLAAQSQAHDQALAQDQQEHDQEMAERQTAAAEQAATSAGATE